MDFVKTLIIKFNNELAKWDITKFRGAVVASIHDADILFHNHEGESLRYGYPLIQYKTIGGKAAIVAVGEGADKLYQAFPKSDWNLNIGGNKTQMSLESAKIYETPLMLNEGEFPYHIEQWLPLNEKNYSQYKSLESVVEQMQMLERTLISNILSLLRSSGIIIDEQLTCTITSMPNIQATRFKQVKLLSFDLDFKCNLQLPIYIGLGKHASVGHGIITDKE